MAFHLVDRSLRRLLPWLLLLGMSMGCEILVRAALAGLHQSAPREEISTAVPFEGTPWVEHGRVAQPGLLVPRKGTQEVRFVRDRGGYPGVSLLVSMDGAMVAEFWEGEALALWLPVGHQTLLCHRRARPDKRLPLQPSAGLEPNSSALLELDVVPSFIPCIRMATAEGGISLSSSVQAAPTPPTR